MSCSRDASKVLFQIVDIINQLSDVAYSMPMDILDGSTLGKHFRHIWGFYQCIAVSRESENLDYAQRAREVQLELSTSSAIEAYKILISDLEHLNDDQAITVISDFHTQDCPRVQIQSTIGRELMYAYDHAIHHLAIIKIAIKVALPEVKLSESLGVAPSTLRFNNQNIALTH